MMNGIEEAWNMHDLKRFVAGADMFNRASDGTTVAGHYDKLGIKL